MTRDGWPGRLAPACLPFIVLLGLLGAARLGVAFMDGPPLAVTGGFGEPSCHQCHFDNPPNAPGGSLAIEGLPDVYVSGRRYALQVTLAHVEMGSAGFQLAVRFAGGERKGQSAGELRAVDARAAVRLDDGQKVEYAQQTEDGTALTGPDTANWQLEWVAPDPPGPVIFHVAGNAGNGDRSEFGDFVYTREVRIRPR